MASFNLALNGVQRTSDVELAGCRIGQAAAFFGVDHRSNAASQFLTSGVQWHYSHDNRHSLQLSAIHTQARGFGFDAQTLMRAAGRYGTGDHWYTPAFRAEVDQVRDGNSGGGVPAGGRALRLGLEKGIGAGHYALSLYRAQRGYDALGSTQVPGRSGLTFSSSWRWLSAFRLSNNLQFNDRANNSDIAPVGQSWTLQGPTGQGGVRWRLHAQYGIAQPWTDTDATPFGTRLALEDLGFAGWRVRPAVGWYRNRVIGDDALPVSGALGRLVLRRTVLVGGLPATLSPSFSFGRSRDTTGRESWASRSGLSVDLRRAANHLNFSLDYLSPGWGGRSEQSTLRMMLRFSRTTSGLFAGL